MFALRAVARRAPRQSITSAARPASRSVAPLARLPPQAHQPHQRLAAASFSTSRVARDEYAQHLATKLASEIDIESEESSNAADSDSNVDSFRAAFPEWDFSGDIAGSQDVFLTRKYEDEVVTAHFSIADFNTGFTGEDAMDPALPDEDDDMEVQSGGANTKGAINQGRTSGGNFKTAPEDSIAPADREELGDEEDQPQPFPVAVAVLVQKPGSKAALKFLLTANEQSFVVEQLIHIPAEFGSSDAQEILKATPESIYAGPPFQQLDEEMQNIIEQYLNARGITSELASVIPDYVDIKEQKEYLGWLGRVKEFVD